jgi:hypothetical protein
MPRNVMKEARQILRKELQALESTVRALDDGLVHAHLAPHWLRHRGLF